MNGIEFIKMMRQDIETSPDKEILSQVVDVMQAAVEQQPFCEIDPTDKTPQDCYKKMATHAQNNRNGCQVYCFSPKQSIQFISEYLGLKSDNAGAASGGIVSLEDFI